MASEAYTNKDYKTFHACLRKVPGAHGLRTFDLFSDFLECAYLSLSQAAHVAMHGRMDDSKEQRYAEIRERHGGNVDGFSEALAVCIMALEAKPFDFLGGFAGEAGLLDGSWKGQFFTPASISTAMSLMVLEDADPPKRREDRLTLAEPACGAGATIIAAATHLKSRGFMPWHYWVDATDLDRRMFHAAYIQFSLLAIPAVVRCGNTLSLEINESALTIMGALHPLRRKADAADANDADIAGYENDAALPIKSIRKRGKP